MATLQETFNLLSENSNLDGKKTTVFLAENQFAGRGLFAAVDIAEGSLIFSECALIQGPKQAGGRACAHCSLNEDGSKTKWFQCQECCVPVCSSKCLERLRISKYHKNECAKLKRLGAKEFSCSSEWLCIFRALILANNERDHFRCLDSNLQSRRHAGCQVLARNEAQAVPMLASRFGWSPEEILMAAGRIDANAFRYTDNSSRAVFSLASMVNHDCNPNARVAFDKQGDLRLLARRDISKAQDITITYCTPLVITLQTRQMLLKSKQFLIAFFCLLALSLMRFNSLL